MSLTFEACTPQGELKAAIEALAPDVEPAWYTSLNADPSLPAWFVAREDGELRGYLSVFDPEGESAEVSAFVAEAHRRRGVFTGLWKAALQAWSPAGRRWLWVVDRSQTAGTALAQRWGRWEFSEATLRLAAAERPAFKGLPDGLTVVAATHDDLDAAAAVHQALGRSARDFLQAVFEDRERQLFLLQEGNRTVGVAGVHRGSDVGLFGLAVHPERQGRGWGRALVLAVLELSADGRDFVLEVDSTNARAEALYRSLGFRDEVVTDYYRVEAER